jgi:hypothetical protein
MKVYDDAMKTRILKMAQTNEPMQRMASYYCKDLPAKDPRRTVIESQLMSALAMIWELSRPLDRVEPPRTMDLAMADALTMLDQDMRQCKRTEKMFRLIDTYGVVIFRQKLKTFMGRDSIERMLK